jgi:hypothetical protein
MTAASKIDMHTGWSGRAMISTSTYSFEAAPSHSGDNTAQPLHTQVCRRLAVKTDTALDMHYAMVALNEYVEMIRVYEGQQQKPCPLALLVAADRRRLGATGGACVRQPSAGRSIYTCLPANHVFTMVG